MMVLQAQVHGSSVAKKNSDDDESLKKTKVFRDDTAQAYDNKGYLSRHSSEPEAQSLEPRKHMGAIDDKLADAAGRAQHRSQSITSGKKEGRGVHGADVEDDQLSLCTPVNPMHGNQRVLEEEVRMNESGENVLPEYMPYSKGYLAESMHGMDRRLGSNRSSGKSSSAHIPCADYYREGRHSQLDRDHERQRMGPRNRSYQDVSHEGAYRYSTSSEFAHECSAPHGRYPQHFGPPQGFVPPPQVQQVMPGPWHPGLQNATCQRVAPHPYGPRVPMMQEPYHLSRIQDPYLPVQMTPHVQQPQYPVRMPPHGPGAMYRPVQKFAPAQSDHGAQPVQVKRNISPVYTGNSNTTLLHKPADVDRKVTSPQPDAKITQAECPKNATEDAPGEPHKNRTNEPVLTDLQDINLSPEDFDAIFAEFNADDLPQ